MSPCGSVSRADRISDGKTTSRAQAAYNTKAESIVSRVEPMPSRDDRPKVSPEKSDAPVTAQFGPAEIRAGSIRQYKVDHSGAKVACYFFVDGRGHIGVAGAAHADLVAIAQRIATDRAYHTSVSQEFVYRAAVDWLKQRIEATDQSSVPPLVDYVEREATKAIRRFEVWFPIPVAQITRPIQIGRTWFRRITKQMMDAYADRSKASASPRNEAFFDRLRSRIQAATAACVEVEAEPIRADEVAKSESEASISVFRLGKL